MINTRHVNRLAAFGLAAILSGTPSALLAADPPPSPQYGPCMMSGANAGMGPGMMGGGYGGMGPGMMGGGHGGMGRGMMGPCWGSGLDLTTEQQARINKIQDETRKERWTLMGEMMDQQARLRDLNLAPQRDNAAIEATYKEFGKLQQKMYESAAAAHQRMETVLTKEQQDKLRSYCPGGGTPHPEKPAK